ncbi:MAG TPA: ribosome silencing factor [Thermoanaerobaculia bacterium]|nr:ribosome silencing factor [Thermoanaerobaculia bacterium]
MMMDRTQQRVAHAVEAALDKKAIALDVLSVGKLTSIGDYFVICSGTTERQTQAIAEEIETKLRELDGVKPLLVEGITPGRWVLLDYGDLIVHIFTEDCRRFYGLERLWGDAPNVTGEYLPDEKLQRHER